MGPLVSDDERPLKGQHVRIHDDLEKERIGHAVDGGVAEVERQQRLLGHAGNCQACCAECELRSAKRRFERSEIRFEGLRFFQ